MKIGFIGAGKMAEAIAAAALKADGVAPAYDIVMCDTLRDRLEYLERVLGIRGLSRPEDVLDVSDVIVLAVKPQDLNELLAATGRFFSRRHLVISIAAGRRLADLESRVSAGTRLVRVMPNLPLQVGAGMSVICPGENAGAEDEAFVGELFGCAGKVISLPEELFDVVTALSGSGPAFFAYIVKLMVSGACAEGMDAESARVLTLQTMLGTAKVLSEGNMSPEDFINAVASPGGTTAEGLSVLRDSDLDSVLGGTLAAATRRGRELSAG